MATHAVNDVVLPPWLELIPGFLDLISGVVFAQYTTVGLIDLTFQSAANVSSIALVVSNKALVPDQGVAAAAMLAGTFAFASGSGVLSQDNSDGKFETGSGNLLLIADISALIGDMLTLIGGVASGAGAKSAGSYIESLASKNTAAGIAGKIAYYRGENETLGEKTLIDGLSAIKVGIETSAQALATIGIEVGSQLDSVASGVQQFINDVSWIAAGPSSPNYKKGTDEIVGFIQSVKGTVNSFINTVLNGIKSILNIPSLDQDRGIGIIEGDHIKYGFYIALPDDSWLSVSANIISTFPGTISASADILSRINAVFGVKSIQDGELLHIPIDNVSGANTLSASLPEKSLYVFDVIANTTYQVGASADGHDSGALIIDTPLFSGFTTFDAGTYSNVFMDSSGRVNVTLTTSTGGALGTLAINPSSGAGALTLSDGLAIATPGGAAFHVTAPSPSASQVSSSGMGTDTAGGSALDVADSAESSDQILLGDLADLGVSLTKPQLEQMDFDFLHPSGTLRTLYVSGQRDDAVYGDSESIAWVGEGSYNEVNFDAADISTSTFTNIDAIGIREGIVINSNEFNEISKIIVYYNENIKLATAGKYDFSASNIDIIGGNEIGGADGGDNRVSVVAEAVGGTTIIGSGYNSGSLTASQLGNDTLIEGNGVGDTLTAGGGVDTLVGGDGGDTFVVTVALADGTSITGGSGIDTLNIGCSCDLTKVSITGVEDLCAFGEVFVTIDQLENFQLATGYVVVRETAANILSHMSVLMERASNITSIQPTDIGVEVSMAAFEADEGILDKIDGGIVVSDTTVNIQSALADIAADSSHITAVVSTDSPVSVSATAFGAEQAALDLVEGGFTVSDTVSNIESHLAGLEGDAAHIDALTPTDGMVSISADVFAADQAALDDVVGGFNISDTATNLANDASEFLADPNLDAIQVTGGSATISGDFSIAYTTTLNLGASTLMLTGPVSFGAGLGDTPNVTGTGRIVTGGADDIGDLIIGGSVLFRNSGTVAQTGSITVGDSTNGAAQITNAPGKNWTINGDVGIAAGNSVAIFNNGGATLAKASGTGSSVISTNFTNLAGTAAAIMVSSGVLQFSGLSNSFLADAISGAGSFAIGGGGTSTIGAGTTIATSGWTIAKVGTTVTLGEALSYAGSFSDTNQTVLNLGTNALTLSGPASFNLGPAGMPIVTGSGRLITSGADTIAGLSLGGSTLFRDNGTVTQKGAITLGDGTNAAAQITDAGTWNIAGDVGIAAGSTAAVINIGGGTLIKTAATGTRSVIAPKIENLNAATGTIEVAAGKLELGGPLSGALALRVDAGSTLLLDKAASAASTASFIGSGGTFQLNDAPDYAGKIAGFGAGDMIDLRSIAYANLGTSLAYSGSAASGTLTVSDGTHAANLGMLGSLAAGSFHLASDNHGGSLVTYG